MRTWFIAFLLIGLTASLVSAKTPNFIIIYIDDLGYSQLSVSMMKDKPEYAHPLHQTPHIKQLAERGMRFSNGYAPSPVCTSSRASIQFGKTTARVGCVSLHDVVMNKRDIDMTKELSLAEMLKAANKGYHTAFFGKGCTPMGWFKDHGYDETDFNFVHANGNAHGDWWEPTTKTPIPADDPKRIFSLARTSVDYLKKRASDKKPFFMMISHYALHVRNTSLKSTRAKYLNIIAEKEGIVDGIPDISRFDANAADMPTKLKNYWERANYAAMVEDLDTSIGQVLTKLKQLGLEENTYVFLASDNGGGSKNPPLQGGKAKMWEGGLRTPMIIAGPGIKPDTQCDTPVAQWDFLPTMHELSGSQTPLPEDLDGVSLKPVLTQGNAGLLAKRDTGLVFHFPAHYTVPITAYRHGDYKLMRQLNTGELKLFDVHNDPGESKDLSKTMPEKTTEMARKLDAYLKRIGAWTMEEVYATREEELRNWITRHKKDISEINQGLVSKPQDAKLNQQLKKLKQQLDKHQSALEKVTNDRLSTRWL